MQIVLVLKKSYITYIWKTKMKINNFWLIHKVYCIKYGVFFQEYLLFMHGHNLWSYYVFFFFLLLLHLSIIRIWSNASLELIPNVSNYHELLLGRRACMRRLHSKGNGIMVLINLKLHLNLCSSGNFHFEQQYAFSQGIIYEYKKMG